MEASVKPAGSPEVGMTSELSQVGVRVLGSTWLSHTTWAPVGMRCGLPYAGSPGKGLAAGGFLPTALSAA